MNETTIGYCLCGSFCTFEKSFEILRELKSNGANILPVMSFNAATIDTRFGKAEDIKSTFTEISGMEIISTINDAEPIGPKKMCDVLVVAPCTGNTLAKLASGITDTPVLMACKSHLRTGRPVVIALATNDALGASAQNLGKLLNTKNIYFVPMYQDDCYKKPTSLVADFDMLNDAVESALSGKQIQPVFC